MLAWMEDRGDHRLLRDSATNGATSHPTLTIHPASTNSTASNDSVELESLPRRSVSGYGSVVGLTHGGGTSYSSGLSVSTSLGIKNLPSIGKRALVIEDQDLLTVPRPSLSHSPRYECPFDRLGCLLSFTDPDRWYEHSLTHFRSHNPPSQNSCCFCDEKFDEINGNRSWEKRLYHIKLQHHDRGEGLKTSRFDSELYRYMWGKDLISRIEYKDLTAGVGGALASGEADTHGSASGFNTHLAANDTFRRNR